MRYYIGTELSAADDWESIYPPIEAPRNYRDPQKIAEYIERRKYELATGEAAMNPLTGRVTRVVVIKNKPDETQDTVFDEANLSVGAKFLDWFLKDTGMDVDPAKLKDQLVIGCNVRRDLRLMAIEYIFVNGSLPFSLWWALDLEADFRYNQIPGFIDPLSAIFGTSSTDMAAAGRRFGLVEDSEDTEPDLDAEARAILACQLAKRMGL